MQVCGQSHHWCFTPEGRVPSTHCQQVGSFSAVSPDTVKERNSPSYVWNWTLTHQPSRLPPFHSIDWHILAPLQVCLSLFIDTLSAALFTQYWIEKLLSVIKCDGYERMWKWPILRFSISNNEDCLITLKKRSMKDSDMKQWPTSLQLQWSKGSVMTFGTQVRGFKPGRSRWTFQGEKILSTPSFGGEVKPSVPCWRFTACKRFLNVMWKSGIFRQNLWAISLPCSSTFGC